MKTYTIPRSYRKLLKRCAQKYFPGEEKALLSKADLIYNGFCKETPSIGGRKNLLASNLDMAMTFFAFYEATDRRVTREMFLEVTGWMTEKRGFLKKLFDFNKPWMAKLMYRIYIPYAKKANENKQNGKWNNTWAWSSTRRATPRAAPSIWWVARWWTLPRSTATWTLCPICASLTTPWLR